MKAIPILVATVVVVDAGNLLPNFLKKKKEPLCEDGRPQYCALKVPHGYCRSPFASKKEIVERCQRSCRLCCRDEDPEKCQKMKSEGLCKLSDNFILFKSQCGVTCNLCNDGSMYGYSEDKVPVNKYLV